MRCCTFCCSTSDLSREHVFAQWISALYPDEIGDHYRREVSLDAPDEVQVRSGRGIDFVTKQVCQACNNGWMSSLETGARPIIEPMIRGEGRLLDISDQVTVASWATKTMLALQPLNPGRWRVAGDDAYHWFYG